MLFNSSLMKEIWPLEAWERIDCAEIKLAPYFFARFFSLACAINASFSLAAIFAWETACSKHDLMSYYCELVVVNFKYIMTWVDRAKDWLFLYFKTNE